MLKTSRSEKNVALFQDLSDEGALLGPVNLNSSQATSLLLPPLLWNNWGSSGSLKITNNGHTVFMTGHWKEDRPSVFGGPFQVPFSFGQVHFHWGPSDSSGSEHTINGHRFPMEMHVLLYKSSYDRPKIALREKDGISVFVYFFEIGRANESLQPVIDGLTDVQRSYRSAALTPEAISVVPPFTDEYFLYWGSIMTDHCAHALRWLVCPQPQHVSSAQLAEFRKLLNPEKQYITRNYCDPQPLHGRTIFLATCDKSKQDIGEKQFFSHLGKNLLAMPDPMRRCCLSARKKRLRSRNDKESFNKMLTSLNHLDKEKRVKLKELEVLSKRVEKEEWYNTIERRVRELEIKTAMKQNHAKITKEFFEKWRLKRILFREVPQKSAPSTRRSQREKNEHKTFYIMNPLETAGHDAQNEEMTKNEKDIAIEVLFSRQRGRRRGKLEEIRTENQLANKNEKNVCQPDETSSNSQIDDNTGKDNSEVIATNTDETNQESEMDQNNHNPYLIEKIADARNYRRNPPKHMNFIERNKSLAATYKRRQSCVSHENPKLNRMNFGKRMSYL